MANNVKRHALYFVRPGRVDVQTESVPPPGPGQISVRSLISAISPGTERLIYRGQVPTDMALDETITDLSGSFKFPFKYGYAMIGQVTTVGQAVKPEWQDRLVFAFHPHESHFNTTPDNVFSLPADLPPEEAVFLPNMETAVNLVLDGQPIIGEHIIVFGQGVVGLLTTALLAQFPLDRLVTVDPDTQRQALSLALGAHTSLSPQQVAARSSNQQGGGFDLIYELSGNPAALNQAIKLAGFASRIVVGSWYGTKSVRLDLGGAFHRQRLRLISSQVSTIAPKLSGRWSKSRRIKLAWQLVRQIQPAHFITHRFHITQAAQAYTLLDQTPETALQIILTYS